MKNAQNISITRTHIRLLAIIYFLHVSLLAQHRGDNLAFQGIAELLPHKTGYATGGVFASSFGEINSIFANPAGLSTLNGFQLSISLYTGKALWREDQDYRPNRLFVTLPFYLEGLYIPDPANNSIMDYNLALDSSYIVVAPDLGNDPYSKEAADWQREIDLNNLDDIAVALPIRFKNQSIVLAAAYSQRPINDFDRNETYLTPHLGYSEYELAARVDGSDTLTVFWSDFLRKRTGDARFFTAGFSFKMNENLSFGISIERMTAATDDIQKLDRVGYFNLFDENEFSFSYDTLLIVTSGVSDFSSTTLKLGGLFQHENFNIGVSLTLPTEVVREWDYEYKETSPDTNIAYELNQKFGQDKFRDKLSLPLISSIGFNVKPHNAIIFLFDVEHTSFSKAQFELDVPDTTHRDWADRTAFKAGLEFLPFKAISFLAGYQYKPQIFIPDGVAFKDQGPPVESYTFGLRIKLYKLGRFDCIFTDRRSKYYDSYYSNTNYVFQSMKNIYFSYTFVF